MFIGCRALILLVFHLMCFTSYVFIMAFILSLFSDAEMMGAGSPAPAVASGDAVPKQEPATNVCAADSGSPVGLSEEWVHGFKTNPVEERERLKRPIMFGANPCLYCEYQGLCDDDYCAMLLGPIDMPHAPTRRGWKVYGL